MAHPHIMVDRPAPAELHRAPQHPLRRQVIEVVISGRDGQPVLRHDRVAQRQHRSGTRAGDLRKLDPPLGRLRQQPRRAGVTGRDDRDEHPVHITGPDGVRLPWELEPAIERREIERDHRILRRPHRIIPQPHEPRSRRAARIPPLDRQRRPVDRIKRLHPARPPPEPKRASPIIPRCLVPKQRMIVDVLALPDQPREIVRAIEHRIDTQRMGPRRHHRSHHRPRKIDAPEARIEALQPGVLYRIAGLGEPVRHRCLQIKRAAGFPAALQISDFRYPYDATPPASSSAARPPCGAIILRGRNEAFNPQPTHSAPPAPPAGSTAPAPPARPCPRAR